MVVAIVVNAKKHIFYCDVYVFVNRLKNLVILYDNEAIKNVIVACLRSFALM